jgi:hypothetical protein
MREKLKIADVDEVKCESKIVGMLNHVMKTDCRADD